MSARRSTLLTTAPRPTGLQRSRLQVWSQPGFLFQAYVNAQGQSRPLAAHCHDEYQFIFSVDAPERYRCRGTSWLVPAGSMIVFRPGEVHAAEGEPWTQARDKPVAFWSVLLSEFLARGTDDGKRSWDGRTTASPLLRQALFRLKQSLDDPLHASQLSRDAALQAFCRVWMAHRGGTREGPADAILGSRAVAKAREFLHAHPAQDCSLAFLAGLTSVSASHLCALFRREVGQSMHAYQLQRRVEQAKGLLRAGVPIAQAAVESGFADQSHFHRHFRRLVGVSPGQYQCVRRG